MKTLTHLRDFLTEEELKFLPGRMQAGNFILLQQNKQDEKKLFHMVLQVFTADGTWIGEISQPDWIPSKS